MIKDAEVNSVADKEKLEQIETKNQAESLCYKVRKQVEQMELDNGVSEEEKIKIRSAVDELENLTKGQDFVLMRNKMEELSRLIVEIE